MFFVQHFVNSDDGDGKLTKDEFHNFSRKIFKNENIDRVKTEYVLQYNYLFWPTLIDYFSEIFGTFDTNKDGMVTFREFILVAIAISNDDLNTMLTHAFHM